jgi:hypothetical protein
LAAKATAEKELWQIRQRLPAAEKEVEAAAAAGKAVKP